MGTLEIVLSEELQDCYVFASNEIAEDLIIGKSVLFSTEALMSPKSFLYSVLEHKTKKGDKPLVSKDKEELNLKLWDIYLHETSEGMRLNALPSLGTERLWFQLRGFLEKSPHDKIYFFVSNDFSRDYKYSREFVEMVNGVRVNYSTDVVVCCSRRSILSSDLRKSADIVCGLGWEGSCLINVVEEVNAKVMGRVGAKFVVTRSDVRGGLI